MKLFYGLRVHFKLMLRKLKCIPSFCKICGRDVHDFQVDDKIWDIIEKDIKYGTVLCYDCFCELCEKNGYPSVWKLDALDSETKGDDIEIDHSDEDCTDILEELEALNDIVYPEKKVKKIKIPLKDKNIKYYERITQIDNCNKILDEVFTDYKDAFLKLSEDD